MDQGFFYLSPTLFLDALPIAVSYTCVLVEGSIVGTRKSPQRMIPGPKILVRLVYGRKLEGRRRDP